MNQKEEFQQVKLISEVFSTTFNISTTLEVLKLFATPLLGALRKKKRRRTKRAKSKKLLQRQDLCLKFPLDS
jgi:hypothetical protein